MEVARGRALQRDLGLSTGPSARRIEVFRAFAGMGGAVAAAAVRPA